MGENFIITVYRRVKLARITSGDISEMPPVTHIAFGRGGVDVNGEPVQPDINASELRDEIARYPIDGVAFPIPTTAQYKATIPPGDLAGEEISEAALVDADGRVCAIKNFYVKRKDGGVTFEFTLDDTF